MLELLTITTLLLVPMLPFLVGAAEWVLEKVEGSLGE